MNTVGDHVVSQWFKIDTHTTKKEITGMFITVSVCIIDRVVFFHTTLSVSDSGKRIITEFYSKVIKHRHISFLHHQTLTL